MYTFVWSQMGFRLRAALLKSNRLHAQLLALNSSLRVLGLLGCCFLVFWFADHKKSSVRRNVNVGPFCLDSSTLPSSDYAHMIWAKYSLTTWNVSVMFHISTAVQKYSLLRCISNHPWQWKWDFINSIIWCNHSDGSCDRCQPHCNSWFDGWQYW